MYREVSYDPNVLVNTLIKALGKIRLLDDLSSNTLNYFLLRIQNPLGFIFSLKFISVNTMYLVDQ